MNVEYLHIVRPLIACPAFSSGSGEYVKHGYSFRGWSVSSDIAHLVGILLVDVIVRNDKGVNMDAFNYDMSTKHPKPRPYVFSQYVFPQYRGQGVSGKLILAANDWSQKQFGAALYSSIGFVQGRGGDNAQRVWRKLIEEKHAFETTYQGKLRFGCF